MPRATHILPVPVIGQRTGYECGNTALTAVLQYLGKHVTVDEVGALANTRRVGTDHGGMIAAAVKTGAHVFAKAGGSGKAALAEVVGFVSRGLPVVCGWWSMGVGAARGEVDSDFDPGWSKKQRMARDCGHYSVLRGYTPATLLFMDPQDGPAGTTIGYCEVRDQDWLRVWYDTDTDAYQLVEHWYMVVNYDRRRFADLIGAGEDHPRTRR